MKTYTVVSPGRVNIIGEHVDHQNYPVFPCAIKQSIQVEVQQYNEEEDADQWTSIPALTIHHRDPKFESVIFQSVHDIKITPNEHHWYNYLLASYFGICEYIHYGMTLPHGHSINRAVGLDSDIYVVAKENRISPCCKKFKIVVGGEGVPQAAGLSSSSALTCAGSLAWLVESLPSSESPLNSEDPHYAGDAKCRLSLSRNEIAHVSAHGEGYSGTASGGMDQAAICLSQEGAALFINFKPLTSESIKLPKELALVVANTGRAAPKAISAAKMYNKRVFELKCACYLILKKHKKQLTPEDLIVNGLRDVLRLINMDEEQFLNFELDKCIKKEVYTRRCIDQSIDEATKLYILENRCGMDVWKQNDDFHCYDRVRHVLTENARVVKCVKLCKEYGSKESTPESVLQEIGKLLDGSFTSLDTDFDCGCPELRSLVRICKDAGAYGSRLTGAGWGGCTVSLVHKNKVDQFLNEVEREYYEPIITGKTTLESPLEFMIDDLKNIRSVLFATEPSAAARVEYYC